MISIYIELFDIGNLVNLLSKMECVVNVVCGNKVANGKSYLGVVSIYTVPQMIITFPNGYNSVDEIYAKRVKERWGI